MTKFLLQKQHFNTNSKNNLHSLGDSGGFTDHVTEMMTVCCGQVFVLGRSQSVWSGLAADLFLLLTQL